MTPGGWGSAVQEQPRPHGDLQCPRLERDGVSGRTEAVTETPWMQTSGDVEQRWAEVCVQSTEHERQQDGAPNDDAVVGLRNRSQTPAR